MEQYYIIFCAVIIPLFYVYQPTDARNYLFSLATGLYVVGWLAIGKLFSETSMFNLSDILLIGFGLFYFMSCSWASNQREASTVAITWVSGIVLFFAVQQVSVELVMLSLYFPALIMIPAVMWQLYTKKRDGEVIEVDGIKLSAKPCGVFGNTNYFGVYMAIVFFPGLWLCQNTSAYFIIPQLFLIFFIFLSRCYAAFIAFAAGCAATYYCLSGDYNGKLIIILGIIAGFIAKKFLQNKGKGVSDRKSWFFMALNLIKKRLLFGWGPRSFRIEQYYSLKDISLKSKKDPSFTDYVHNDYLEIFVETGVVGIGMFLLFLASLFYGDLSPIIVGGLTAMLISSLFFFSFYKSHIAVLFWCMAGLSTIPKPFEIYSIPWPILLIFIIGFLILSYQYALKKLMAIYYWFHVVPTADSKENYLYLVTMKCLKFDPYNSLYLRAIHPIAVKISPELAMKLAARLIEHFDGNTPMEMVTAMQPKIQRKEK